MKPIHTIAALFALSILAQSCVKETQEMAEEVGLAPATCGTDGARLQATVGGASYCATAQVIATGGNGSVLVSGLDLTGGALVVQFDDLAVGTHAITAAENGVMYMSMGSTYVVGPDQTGSITITEHNADTHRLKATFEATVMNTASGLLKSVSGNVDVIYTLQE